MALSGRFRFFAAACALSVCIAAPWPAFAGTTGSLSGLVTDAASAPVAGAMVTLVSPSQRAQTITDAGGHWSVLSLSPDTYAVSASKSGYEPTSVTGVTVFADQAQTIRIAMQKALRQIAQVTAKSSIDLVKPGTTADVYSVNAAVTKAAQGIGGGGSLTSAYSALAAVPGLFVPPDQQGWNQTVYIRGGNYDQIGYEFDGVPVNRSFDNYPGSTAGNIGQQELQVYTGGGTSGASATGLAGFINQVIRTGTYPGYGNAQLALGTPTFYHNLNLEAGGASPDRNFSYYVGFSGYNQDYRYLDQFNGAGVQDYFGDTGPTNLTSNMLFYPAVYPNCIGPNGVTNPFTLNPGDPGYLPTPPGIIGNGFGGAGAQGCYATISPAYASYSSIADREIVANVHIGIPHKSGGGKDDIQILFNPVSMLSELYSGVNDAGPGVVADLAGQGLANPGIYPDYVTWPAGTHFGQPAAGLSALPYLYPGSPTNRCANVDPTVPGACPVGANGLPTYAYLPPNARDTSHNDSAIFKVQYQKNFSHAYLRLFGYSFYSDWLQEGPSRYGIGSGFGGDSYDYELNAHTRGATLQFADQLNAKNLLTATLNYTTSSTDRYNNTNYQNDFNATVATNLTDGSNCYADAYGTGIDGTAYRPGMKAPCNDPISAGTFAMPDPGIAPCNAGDTCPAVPPNAQFLVTYTGNQGFENTVKPIFTSLGVDDEFRPTDRWNIDAALRFDRYQFDLGDTSSDGQNFWFSAAQHEFCYNPSTGQPVLVPEPPASGITPPPFVGFNCPVDSSSGTPVQSVHPDGLNGDLLFSNDYGHTVVDTAFTPRLSATYTINPDTVLRLSAGRYSQEPQNYEIQYGAKDNNLAYPLFQAWWGYGFTTPRHDPLVQYSDNFDFSYERHFKGTDMSMKVTPYYRYATNQLYDISVGFGLSGGLNSGTERIKGLELQLTKGDFDKDGLSWVLSYTYLNGQEKFGNYPGTTINPIDPYNQYIQAYNALTKSGGGSQCYVNDVNIGTGVVQPDPSCAALANFNPPIANPYYNAPSQPLMDRNGWYAVGGDYPYLVPNTISALVNYKHKNFSITPALTLNEGTTYGNPAGVAGNDPRVCTNNSAAITSSSISTSNPLQADYTSCGLAATPSGSLYVPNPDTGRFDTFGEYRQPSQLNLSMNLGYQVSPRIKATLSLTNLVNECFGGSKTSWSTQFPPNSFTCGYISNAYYISNFYNGTSPTDLGANGAALNPTFAHPYIPAYADTNSFAYPVPFNAYVQLEIKL
ncbi:MAG: TonB-dependent receptor [Candidatus Eremiobacteraeota bacterium]|nr:TonB-dependent receptor [Candidatus Eremiobacteraeota bacterium]